MTIPDYQTLMLPLLKLLEDGEEHTIRDCVEKLAEQFQLTAEERHQLTRSGVPLFENRISWARTYLKKAGLLEAPRRAMVRITERGKEILAQNPERIDIKFLPQFEEFRQFIMSSEHTREPQKHASEQDDDLAKDPVEAMEEAFARHQQILIDELCEAIDRVSPAFFENLVVLLLTKMGYGGGSMEAASVVGRSGDEGIDGIINEDKLGLDVIYIQAKRWASPVGRPEVQKFVGALHGKRAKKGVFITTSSFTPEAQDYVLHLEPKVVLIDGRQLAKLMIEHNVGVAPKNVYELKAVDRDFFEEVS
jgi:restriction system protein